MKPEWFDSCPLLEMRVVAIDPGSRDFVTGMVKGDTKEKPQIFRALQMQQWQ